MDSPPIGKTMLTKLAAAVRFPDEAKKSVNPVEREQQGRLNTADPAIGEKPVAQGRPEAVSADPDQSEATASGVVGATDIAGVTPPKVADPIVSDDAIRQGSIYQSSRSGEAATRKRSKRGKSAETIEVIPPSSPAAGSNNAVKP